MNVEQQGYTTCFLRPPSQIIVCAAGGASDHALFPDSQCGTIGGGRRIHERSGQEVDVRRPCAEQEKERNRRKALQPEQHLEDEDQTVTVTEAPSCSEKTTSLPCLILMHSSRQLL